MGTQPSSPSVSSRPQRPSSPQHPTSAFPPGNVRGGHARSAPRAGARGKHGVERTKDRRPQPPDGRQHAASASTPSGGSTQAASPHVGSTTSGRFASEMGKGFDASADASLVSAPIPSHWTATTGSRVSNATRARVSERRSTVNGMYYGLRQTRSAALMGSAFGRMPPLPRMLASALRQSKTFRRVEPAPMRPKRQVLPLKGPRPPPISMP